MSNLMERSYHWVTEELPALIQDIPNEIGGLISGFATSTPSALSGAERLYFGLTSIMTLASYALVFIALTKKPDSISWGKYLLRFATVACICMFISVAIALFTNGAINFTIPMLFLAGLYMNVFADRAANDGNVETKTRITVAVSAISLILLILLALLTQPQGSSSHLTPQETPNTGQAIAGAETGSASYGVLNSSDKDIVVIVKGSNDVLQVAFFIAAGEEGWTTLPEDTYTVQAATGSTWYGPEKLFGSKTNYSQPYTFTIRYGESLLNEYGPRS